MFDFLANAVITDQAEVKTTKRSGGPRKEFNPEGLAIRLFCDGRVFPSQELVEKFNLEYAQVTLKEAKPVGTPAEGEEQKYQYFFNPAENPGNGFDVIDTNLFPAFQIPGKRLLLISPVSRKEGKVDLFASTTYEKDGTPKASVSAQGAKTFGADSLIPMVSEVYGVQFKTRVKAEDGTESATWSEEGVDFVDLMLVANPVTGEPWSLGPVTFVPKTFTRGERKGEHTVVRRENAVVYAFMPAPEKAEEANEVEEEVANQVKSA